jgi:hypothetical protein
MHRALRINRVQRLWRRLTENFAKPCVISALLIFFFLFLGQEMLAPRHCHNNIATTIEEYRRDFLFEF